ncbi:MAG: hypothetical protein A2X36_05255 [Elusimicrobia bacterium GWA2_69_24]|nr:MAG: hypothetical protein A2X36_05255 [Elusimicrobia bacterium GWA2_69_24]
MAGNLASDVISPDVGQDRQTIGSQGRMLGQPRVDAAQPDRLRKEYVPDEFSRNRTVRMAVTVDPSGFDRDRIPQQLRRRSAMMRESVPPQWRKIVPYPFQVLLAHLEKVIDAQ